MLHARLDTSGTLLSPFRTHDGMLLAEATFARDGVLAYQRSDGSIRKELRLPETNQDPETLTTFGLAPVTIEHPPVLLNKDNAEPFRKGITLQDVQYVGKGGFVRGKIAVMDSAAVSMVESGEKIQLSAGYTCDIEETPGVWNGERYDAIQRNVRVNHVAMTRKGRAGPAVKIHLDSEDEIDFAVQMDAETSKPDPLPKRKRMATVQLDGVSYEDVPEVFASVAAPRLKELETLKTKFDSTTGELSDLRSRVSELEEERDHQEGRADASEVCLTNAEIILEDLGYRRDGEGGYYKEKSMKKDKKPPFMKAEEEDMEMEEEDMDDEDMDDEDAPMPPFKKKGAKKDGVKKDGVKKDAGCKKDSDDIDVKAAIKELSAAWREADKLVPAKDGESFSDRHFDSADTPADVRRLVVAELRPKLSTRIDSASEGYIDGVYDLIKEEIESRADSEDSGSDREDSDFRADAADELLAAIGASRSSASGASRSKTALSESAQRRMNAFKQPLSLTKDR